LEESRRCCQPVVASSLRLGLFVCLCCAALPGGHGVVIKKVGSLLVQPKFKRHHPFRSGWFGGGDIVEDDDAPMANHSATCFESFPAPERGSTVCPEACPFMRYDQDKVCHWKCITEHHCYHAPNQPLGVADKATGLCTVCRVAGCARCTRKAQECAECKEGFDTLSDGSCVPESRFVWRLVYLVLLAVVLLVAAWMLVLPFRTPVNTRVVEEALLHRSFAKVRHEEGSHKLYPLRTNLCSEFIPSGGVGIMLHFRFEKFALYWSIFVTLAMGSVAWWHHQLDAADILVMAPQHEEALEACTNLTEEDQADLENMRKAFLVATCIVYGVSTLGALAFAVFQRQKYVEIDEQTSTMEDFALFCEGFPVESWGSSLEKQPGQMSLEEEYTNFFRSAGWGDSVLGVSIAWNIDDKQEIVEDLLTVASARMEVKRGHADTRMAALCTLEPRCSPRLSDAESGEDAPISSRGNGIAHHVSKAPHRFCRLDVEGILLGESPLGEKGTERLERDHTAEELKELFELQTTGCVFAVFKKRSDLDRALKTPLQKFKGEHEISFQHLECDAATVLWTGFSTTIWERVKHVVKGILGMGVMMLVWATCFYGPYAYYVLSWNKVAGASQGMNDWSGFMQNTLLGLVITIGNQAVYAGCSNTAEKCQFTNRDSRDMLNVVLYTFAVTLNTIFDLALVLLMAHGWQQDSGLDEEALIRNPSMQHALFVQLVGYIYPGTILIPFVIEPLVTVTIPFYLFMWLIRSRKEVDRVHAEQLMVCPPFDLNRYGDIIINMALCSLIFFLTSVNIWWLFVQLTSASLIIYVWDHYKYIRESQRTMFASKDMDICGQYLMVMPCSILAGAFAFKFQGGQAMVRGWDRHEFFTMRMEWLIVIGAIIVHAILHLLILRFVVPKLVRESEAEADPYEEVAKNICCNWFNSNPVQCLRSSYHFVHDPPHVFDVPGKGHLHMANHEIHAYYEAPEFEEEHSLFQEALSEVRQTLDYVKQEAKLALTHLQQSIKSIGSSRSARSRVSSKNLAAEQTEPEDSDLTP